MGCDIHPIIQVRQDRTVTGPWAWEVVAIPDRSRCYEFFGILAGVRQSDDKEPLAECRGLPSDFCDWDRDRYLSQEHSATWFTLREMEAFDPKFDSDENFAPIQWDRWLRTMRFYKELYSVSSDDVRAVMDFAS